MFDIGFWEIMVIGVVALLVVGPERLPGLARNVGRWVGKARRFVASVKMEVDKEIKADELRKILDAQAQSNPIHDFIDESSAIKNELDFVRKEITATKASAETVSKKSDAI